MSTSTQLCLVEQFVQAVTTLRTFSFLHFQEVGMDGMASSIATEDLAGLETCDAVLPVMTGRDPGRLFEIGHAWPKGIPVVMLAEIIMEAT